ncbi:MAG: AAA-like domain-containing protein [Cyanobacteria bacterium P01_F01_bin.150]
MSPFDMSVKASEQGLEIVDSLRRKKGWSKSAVIWANSAMVAQSTLKRFWRKEAIKEKSFKAICQAVGVRKWQGIADVQGIHFQRTRDPGTVIYIERSNVEIRCLKEVRRPGSLIRIKAPRKMGKTQLMQKIFDYAENGECQTVPFNLLQVETADLSNLDRLLQSLCRCTSRRLGLDSNITEVWDPEDTSNNNCTAYLEKNVLSKLEGPLVLGLDNVDQIFPHQAVASDFFRLLRSWHEEAKTFEPLKKLRLVVSHSTEVYIPLNIDHSPFNVGLSIELPEFTTLETLNFAQQYGLDWQMTEVEELRALVGGHPYLIQQAFEVLTQESGYSLTELIKMASTNSGIYRNHLGALKADLQQDSQLMETMAMVVKATNAVRLNSEDAFKLHSLGLIQWHQGKAEPRCLLYRLYFGEYLQ